MPDQPTTPVEATQSATIGTVNIDDVDVWKQLPVVTEPSYDQRASLQIAIAILIIFGGVCLLSYVLLFFMYFKEDATFEGLAEMGKFMVTSILPLVTLAVGYYLGERSTKD